jgi:hypothetical protein
VFTGAAGEVSMAIYNIVEEASHSLGQQLMVDQDEALLGVINIFVAEQGVGGEAVEDLNNDIIHEAGQCIPLIGGLLHFISV